MNGHLGALENLFALFALPDKTTAS
jgi:hypothetical protein